MGAAKQGAENPLFLSSRAGFSRRGICFPDFFSNPPGSTALHVGRACQRSHVKKAIFGHPEPPAYSVTQH
jgi:hypothetical protein